MDDPRLGGMFLDTRPSRPGEFDWDYFDKELARYANAGLYIQFIVFTGGNPPRWLFDHGVPEVVTTPTINPWGQPYGWTYPRYMDPDYRRYYWRMIREVAEHIDPLPTKVRECIISVQTAEGTTGDTGPCKGTPLNSDYVFSDEDWFAFKCKTWKLFDEPYGPKEPRINLLINSGNGGRYHDWLMKNLPDAWFGNRCPNNTDIMLVNTSSENTLFHMIELCKD